MVVLIAVALCLVPVRPAAAHWADLAVAEIVVEPAETVMTLTFPTALVSGVDEDRNGSLDAAEVRRHVDVLEAAFASRIRFDDGALAGAMRVEPAAAPSAQAGDTVAPGTHSTVRLIYSWPRPIASLHIAYGLFVPGVSTASCLATIVYAGQVQSVVFTPKSPELTFPLGGGVIWRQISSFLLLGIEHILTGYDHVLFLIALLMLGGGLRDLLKTVTAFTAAHSVTLSLAALHVVTLPTRLVESLIALSIAYVAIENILRRPQVLRWRWRIAFGFGLVHGLGFASILEELALPRATLAASLVSFNVGVEMGQIAVVTVAFLTLRALQRASWNLTLRRWVSAAVAAAGLFWFVQRAFLS